MSNVKTILIVSVLVILTLGTFTINDSFATHFSENTKWQLVYITDNPICSNYDHQSMSKFDEITFKYFGLYEFENTKYEPLCVNHNEYDEKYETPYDIDLLVLVYSRNIGEVELHSEKMGGLFMHSGIDKKFNNVIIFCDCSNFYYSDPTWILTHELSHFVLYFLEFDIVEIEDLVHQYDDKYDECRKDYDATCGSIYTKLHVESKAYSYSVMPPYEKAIGISELKNNYVDTPKSVLELGKEMTKWWTSGKITEGDYSNALGLLLMENHQNDEAKHEVLFKDGPIVKNIETWEDILLADGSGENKQDVMQKVKEKMKMEDQIFQQTDFTGLPSWFKNTSQYWVEGQITDEEFMFSVKYLKDSGIIREH